MHSNRLRRLGRTVAGVAFGSAFAVPSASYAQSTGIRLEAVSDYTLVCGGSTSCDTDAVQEAQGFWNGMTASGTGWSAGAFYTNNLVWDRDFHDPELTGNSLDNDTYADAPATGISWYIGHGFCDDITTTGCTSDANCSAGSYCPGGTLVAGSTHVCIRQQSRVFQTSSTTNAHGNIVRYGQTFGQLPAKSIAWGEDAASGAWAGVGTNGGTNVAIVTNSCGFRSRYLDSNTAYMFAGMHSLLGTMPTSAIGYFGTFGSIGFSDTVQWSERGANLAAIILANMNAPVGDAWFNPVLVTYHGFTSVGGAPAEGAHFIISKDVTLAAVQFHANWETWNQAKQEAYDGLGLGYWWYRYSCNYNCNALGL